MKTKWLIIKIVSSLMALTLLASCGKKTNSMNTNSKRSNDNNSSVAGSVSDASQDDSSNEFERGDDSNVLENGDDQISSIQNRPWQSYVEKESSIFGNNNNSSTSSNTETSSLTSSTESSNNEKCPYTKRQLLKMLQYLTINEKNRYAIGVGCGGLYVSVATKTFERKTGGAPVTYDFEMSGLPYSVSDRQLKRTISEMVEFTKKGGIICATDHWLTPTNKIADSTNQGANNSRNKITRTQYYMAMTPGNQIYNNFREELAVGANFFKKLETEGVPVVFRPMHESNGSWFWWGVDASTGITGSDAATLYQYVHDYYVKEQGLNNIIWCYCTGLAGNSNENYSWWPGSKYIDISSTDWYLPYGDYEGYYNGAQNLVKGLPFALSELGWDGSGDPGAIPVRETLSYIESRMKDKDAKCAYVGLYFDFGDKQDCTLTDKCITLDMMPTLWKNLGK